MLIWINEKQLAGDSISEALICEKALLLHGELLDGQPSTSANVTDEFKASRGWFEKFRRRTGIHSVVRHGEAVSSDKAEADKFVVEFENYIKSEGYIPQQVFNCNETGLFWKKMPKKDLLNQRGEVSA